MGNAFGQLGLGPFCLVTPGGPGLVAPVSCDNVATPTPVPLNGQKAYGIDAGGYHSSFMMADGDDLACGYEGRVSFMMADGDDLACGYEGRGPFIMEDDLH